jgi:hypothetical protein
MNLRAEKNMRIHVPLLIASLLLLQPTICPAKELVTISGETAAKMKRGKALDLVWAAPEFDGTLGVRIGKISNETEENARVVMDYLPTAFARLVKNDSPYSLNLAVTRLSLREAHERSSAKVTLEGHVVDRGGTVMAVFAEQAEDTVGGNVQDNARAAVRMIVFAMTKDLFVSDLPLRKSPAIIVAAPEKPQASNIIVAAPAGSQPSAASSPAPAPGPKGAVPAPQPVAQAKPKAPSKPVAPPEPVVMVPLISDAVAADMKKGQGIDRIWISPAYDKARGFSIGEVRYQVEERNDGIDRYLPTALAEIAKPDAPCSLQLRIVQLELRSSIKGISGANLKVEGVLTAKDGTLLAAFATRETVKGTGDLVDDCRTAARRVVLAITKNLR